MTEPKLIDSYNASGHVFELWTDGFGYKLVVRDAGEQGGRLNQTYMTREDAAGLSRMFDQNRGVKDAPVEPVMHEESTVELGGFTSPGLVININGSLGNSRDIEDVVVRAIKEARKLGRI